MSRVAVRLGPAIDAYLAAEGALAQAMSRQTILMSSRALELPGQVQALILAHELAHVRQLERAGRDPVRALEDEAWEAANAWLRGRPFQIRGRARGRLNALALIQGKAHPFAEEWYQLGPDEPIGNKSSIKVDKVQVIQNMTLEMVMDKLIEMKGTTEVIVVTHGSEGGLAIPITTGSAAGADVIAIECLSLDRDRDDDSPMGKVHLTAMSNEKVEEITALNSKTQVPRLRDKMNRIRALKLKHIAFRACDVGSSKDTMRTLRNFFGASSISAPRYYDMYGKFTPEFGGDVDKWAERKRKEGFKVMVDGKIGYGTKKGKDFTVYMVVFRAETKDVAIGWVNKHINPNYAGGDVVNHGMLIDPDDPTSPSVVFVRDPEFAANITYFIG